MTPTSPAAAARHPRLLFLATLGVLVASSSGIFAQDLQAQDDANAEISGAFELKFGGYYPSNIDEGTEDQAFESFYGSDWIFASELEVDVYLWKGFGKLGLGGHIGYASRYGTVKLTDPDAAPDEFDSDDAGETRFRIIPLRASLLYRLDYAATKYNVPLVPVGRVGLDYYFWQFKNGENVSSAGGANASGGKAGWHASLALHFLLDVLEPSSAAYFDLNWGINNSYVFGEYMVTRIDGFGAEGLDLSDNMWMFGLAFEY